MKHDTPHTRRRLGMIFVCLTGFAAASMLSGYAPDAHAEQHTKHHGKAQPVEKDMHEFMEYVFQPTYKRLKAAMASEPADNGTWKTIKSDALILAEGGNLLLIRKPHQHTDAWVDHSVDVRTLGGKLYQAARKKDYSEARKQYTSMILKCNSCHNAFAHGEHQLKP